MCGLARALFPADANVDWDGFERDYDRIRDSIARVVPGFERFNERVARPGGFRLPHPVNDGRFAGGGRALLTVNPFTAIDVPPGRLLLQTVRSHDQYNTTIYGLDDRYRGIHQGRRVVFVNPVDLAALGLADGDIVDVVSEFRDGVERRAAASGSSATRPRRARARRTSPRRTCSCPSTAPPTAAAHRRRSRSSCASNPSAGQPLLAIQ